jgi:hypothetical protein
MTIPESRTTSSAAVVAVLLSDGWHRATLGSFTIGPLSLGDYTAPDTLGYRFEEADDTNPYGPAILAGPIDAVLAVRQVTPRDWRRAPRPPGAGAVTEQPTGQHSRAAYPSGVTAAIPASAGAQ